MNKQNVAAAHIAQEILQERARQVDAEGWTPEHDDMQGDGAMAAAAAAYAIHGQPWEQQVTGGAPIAARWPWHTRWFKPTDRRRDLIKAAALIVAEIERLDRKTGSPDIVPTAVPPEPRNP